jgi:hypothetical protein
MTRIHLPVTYGATTGAWTGKSISGIVAAGSGALARATFAAAHGLVTGELVTIAGATGVTALNDTWEVTVVSSTVVDLKGTGALSGAVAGTITASLPAIDISGIDDPDPTVCICVEGLAAGKGALIAIEDTVNDFTASIPRYVVNVDGGIVSRQDFKFAKRSNPYNRFGVTDAKLRVNVLQVDSAAALKVSAWIE